MKHTLELYKQKRYKVISERMMQVDNHNVTEQIKKGRSILLCDCENDSRFANLNLCRHKKFFILFPFLNKLNNKLDNLIDEYEVGKSLLKTEEGKNICFRIKEDLEGLR